MSAVRVVALVLIVAAGLLSSGSAIGAAGQPPADQPGGGIAPEALAQIDALMAEKDARTPAQQKIDSQLLYELRMESGEPIATGIWAVETDLPYAADGHLVVDVQAQAAGLAARLTAAGIEVLSASADGRSLRAHINIDQVETLAADPDVVFIQPRQGAMTTGVGRPADPSVITLPTGTGSRSSEGDVAHLAFAARGAFHVDGTGVKIGVLSNGVTNLAASQAAGDLGPVTVLPGQTGIGDEGTALLEIIHDLAPGAQLYFATALNSVTTFAQNIRALRAAGCDIIVDDVFYFVESPFQDGQLAPTNRNGGVIAQAVNDVIADGALYFSAAGNSGNLDAGTSGTWEGDFADARATTPPLVSGHRVHSFGTQDFNVLTVATSNPINLYWSDPLGASANDYDLFRLNATGTAVLASSTNFQTGKQDPYEEMSGAGALPGQRLVIMKRAPAAPRFLHLGTNRGRLSIPTMGQIHGHAAAADAFAVAATPAVGPFPHAFSRGSLVETFSSDGPRRSFYQANGSPYTPGDVSSTGGILRQKPDITAADGVSVTGVGGFPSPFFGTSAAAPHAAAIAALVKSADPSLTPAQIRTILTSTATDIQAPGVDRDSGAGIVMARAAVGATGVPGSAFLVVDSIVPSDNPGNGNGVPEAGEGATFAVSLTNFGVAPATAISGTLTSPTVGITLAQPSSIGYPDLAPLESAKNSLPLRFTVASDFGCPGSATFTFSARYGGGSSPIAQTFVVPIGVTSYSITRALDGTVPPSSPGVVTVAGQQVGRLFRDGVPSVCGVQKVINTGGLNPVVDSKLRRFESYEFNTCENSAASCAIVTLSGPNAVKLFTAAYLPSFNPDSILQNYKGDPGASAESRAYAFDVGAGAQRFVIDVHDVPVSATPSGNAYTLTVSGICTGSCDPPNHPPIARAKHVTATANEMCVADVAIDDGSSDADGDALTLVQAPPAPYGIGTTSVLLTATDPKGAFSQASGDVTVVDRTPPSIVCPSPITTTTNPGVCAASVSFAPPTASDACSNPTNASTDIASGFAFPLGTTIVKGKATDAAGNEAFCAIPVTVVDNEAPAISDLAVRKTRLHSHERKLVDYTVDYDAADLCGPVVTSLSVTFTDRQRRGGHDDHQGHDSSRDGPGHKRRGRDHADDNDDNDHDGNDDDDNHDDDDRDVPDFVIVDNHHVRLRADHHHRGRIYTITVTAVDGSANSSSSSVTVRPSHDRD